MDHTFRGLSPAMCYCHVLNDVGQYSLDTVSMCVAGFAARHGKARAGG